VPVPRRLRQEGYVFNASLGYIGTEGGREEKGKEGGKQGDLKILGITENP
jgi:hypothetical protein